jgi:hypothetical protein
MNSELDRNHNHLSSSDYKYFARNKTPKANAPHLLYTGLGPHMIVSTHAEGIEIRIPKGLPEKIDYEIESSGEYLDRTDFIKTALRRHLKTREQYRHSCASSL